METHSPVLLLLSLTSIDSQLSVEESIADDIGAESTESTEKSDDDSASSFSLKSDSLSAWNARREWLLQEDYRKLDKDALAAIASTIAQRKAFVALNFTNGSYNIILRIEFEDGGPSWICRIPRTGGLFENGNEAMLKEHLHSTISTMVYVSNHTSIPVPVIYGYSLDCHNTAKTPYIFMQEFHNTAPFSSVYADWEEEHIKSIIKEWALYHLQLATLQFDGIGSIHIDLDNTKEKVEIGQIIAPINSEEGFDEIDANRGPYHSTMDYLLSISEFKRRCKYEKWCVDKEPMNKDLQAY